MMSANASTFSSVGSSSFVGMVAKGPSYRGGFRLYEELARQEIAEQQAKEQRKLQAEIEANETRERLRKTIKL